MLHKWCLGPKNGKKKNLKACDDVMWILACSCCKSGLKNRTTALQKSFKVPQHPLWKPLRSLDNRIFVAWACFISVMRAQYLKNSQFQVSFNLYNHERLCTWHFLVFHIEYIAKVRKWACCMQSPSWLQNNDQPYSLVNYITVYYIYEKVYTVYRSFIVIFVFSNDVLT